MGQGSQEWGKENLWKTAFKKFEVIWSAYANGAYVRTVVFFFYVCNFCYYDYHINWIHWFTTFKKVIYSQTEEKVWTLSILIINSRGKDFLKNQ